MGRKQRKGGRRGQKINTTKAKAEPSSPNVLEKEKSVPHFPDEIIVHILSRLPLKNLSGFRRVSKQWLSMISDIYPAKFGRQKFVLISKLGEASYALRSIDPESNDVRVVLKPWNKINPSGHLVRLCGSCNGLLLVGVDDDLLLWNPVINYCRKVLSYERLRVHDKRIVSGLCYDSTTNEYKVVLAFDSFVLPFHQLAGESVAVVGSSQCKSWTRIPLPYNVSSLNSGPVVNGYLHWFVHRKPFTDFPSPNEIFYFNPQMGKFEKVPTPQPKHVNGEMW